MVFYFKVKQIFVFILQNAGFRLLLGGILKEFGGFIIPLSSICYSSICQNNLTPKEIRCSFYGSLLPFKSVMDSYCARRTQALVDMIDRGENHLCNKPFCLGMRGLLCSSGIGCFDMFSLLSTLT